MNTKVIPLKRHHWDQVKVILNKSGDSFIDEFLNDNSTVGFVAVNDDEVVGFVYGYVLKRLESMPMLYIHSVDVKEEYRNQGIGAMIVNEMLLYAQLNKFHRAFLISNRSNKSAMRLYSKIGGKIDHDDSVVFEFDEVK
jgi:ribosomal protein S18 acetylase RimI-like enzyme